MSHQPNADDHDAAIPWDDDAEGDARRDAEIERLEEDANPEAAKLRADLLYEVDRVIRAMLKAQTWIATSAGCIRRNQHGAEGSAYLIAQSVMDLHTECNLIRMAQLAARLDDARKAQ